KERFADRWAGEFLVPTEGLRQAVEQLGVDRRLEAEHVIQLQRHFGVSYGMMLLRLRHVGLVSPSRYEQLTLVSPVALASQLGYSIAPDEWAQDPSRWRLERFPRRFVRLLVRGLREERLSPSTAAGLTGLTLDEIVELVAPPDGGDEQVIEELREYERVAP
ncbi:MAG: ImmA/IrrE family metallo-endopeptidase, partial [Thermoleophilia bacterium]|nr:ImmA/IrrE family metallo-endopeptidase [Thermoleophilia bacterium]